MKTKHTKGEWIYQGASATLERGFDVPSKDKIHTWEMTIRPKINEFSTPSIGKAFGKTEKECLFNAKLIASAPEMLKELLHTYLNIQILARHSVNMSVKTDSIRAGLRNTISEALGIEEQIVQAWCEGNAMSYNTSSSWEAIQKATS